MKERKYILFDLDGTLSDPGEGIIGSLALALKHYGIEGDPEILRTFIGPPADRLLQAALSLRR